jgi:hypothetical protein
MRGEVLYIGRVRAVQAMAQPARLRRGFFVDLILDLP